jgi:hypothetical protein
MRVNDNISFSSQQKECFLKTDFFYRLVRRALNYPGLVMKKKVLAFKLHKDFDQEILDRITDLFHGENLVQVILHAHLLIERGLTWRISQKLANPEIMEDGKYGRWSFQQKLAFYIGLYDPPEDRQEMLSGFNRLRNMIAHRFVDEAKCVSECLPWKAEQTPLPDPLSHVTTVAGLLLFFELGIIREARRLDVEEEHT